MAYITDLIGDEYLKWGKEYVLIHATTGKGKTFFVLKKLLAYAVQNRGTVVYLCNRKILNRQMKAETEKQQKELFLTSEFGAKGEQLTPDQKDSMKIYNYQYVERIGLHRLIDEHVKYIIYDEAHYLLTESLFNSYANYWYEGIAKKPVEFPIGPSCTQVFLTATPEPLYDFLAVHLQGPKMLGRASVYHYPFEQITEQYKTKGEYMKQAAEYAQDTQKAGWIKDSIQLSEELSELKKSAADLGRYAKKMMKARKLFDLPEEYFDEQQALNQMKTIAEERRGQANFLFIKYFGCMPRKITVRLMEELENSLRGREEGEEEKGRSIHPGQDEIIKIQDSREQISDKIRIYRFDEESPYQDMETLYFDKVTDLLPKIRDDVRESRENKKDTDKWLVFVDSEKDGIALEAQLKVLGIPTVLVSSPRLKNGKEAQAEFRNIALEQKFKSTVLIATSVMDCGVSIHDEQIKNIALSHYDKTTFLQMLGRVRLDKTKQKVRLYVRYFSGGEINGICHRYEEQLRFLTEYGVLNKERLVNETSHVPVLSEERQKRVVEKALSENFHALLYQNDPRQGHQRGYVRKPEETLLNIEPGLCAYTYLLHLVNRYRTLLSEYAQTKDQHFYLKEQLSWLGKTYGEQNWNNYHEVRKSICEFMGKYRSWRILDIEESVEKEKVISRREFVGQCMKLIQEYPIRTKTSKVWVKKMEMGILPGKVALCHMMEEIELQYRITSKQTSFHRKRVMQWTIIETE